MDLSEEQQAAVNQLAALKVRTQTLGGYAGTGKTTVIKELSRRLPGFAVVAYTGKAAHVLRSKGVESASTIHSCIYYPEEKTVFVNGGWTSRMQWTLRPEIEFNGFIVDEASMVSEDIFRDLSAFRKPIIFVGDHGQLEPVGDKFDLMKKPDITLETIHRNAGEIAHFAEFLREGGVASQWSGTGDQVIVVPPHDASIDDISDCDQFICAFNKNRVVFNKAVRKLLKFPSRTPVIGDRVMCLRNNKEFELFNGMQGTVDMIRGGILYFKSGDEVYPVEFVPTQFNKVEGPGFTPGRSNQVPFDYCYAITCHKAQGDEWDHVMVMEDPCGSWDHRRWSYTAASRARKKLTWVYD